ncbi:MAG TPA: glycosyltransferase family 39 protein, partial [Flavobacteriales bacterium]|nr:glycosyltransferase family 39 protein [Flavobacteriales bacterium]
MDPLFLIGRMGRRSSLRDVEGQGQMARFRADVRSGWKELRRTTSNSHKWLVFAVVAAGLVLRLARLGDGITYDEAFTASFYASRTTGFLLSDYSWPGNHLLFTLLVKLTMQLFGTHLWSLRLPALLAGVCVLPLFYLFVRQMFNRYVAVLALSFVAASGALIEYSASSTPCRDELAVPAAPFPSGCTDDWSASLPSGDTAAVRALRITMPSGTLSQLDPGEGFTIDYSVTYVAGLAPGQVAWNNF